MKMKIDASEYTEERVLGKGSYGVVSCLKHKKTNQRVARKQLKNNQMMSTHGFMPRLLREVEALQRYRHKNIVQLYDIIVDEQPATGLEGGPVAEEDMELLKGQTHYPSIPGEADVYIFMEYVEYTLSKVIRNASEHPAALTMQQRRVYSKQLLAGLAYLQENNVLHLDIKPDNVLVTADGVLKLADFGLSREERVGCRYSPTVVTSSYRPPEIFCYKMGESKPYGHTADVWSVGCVVAELFILQHPLFHPVVMNRSDKDIVSEIITICGSDGWTTALITNKPRIIEAFLGEGVCKRCRRAQTHSFPKVPQDAINLISSLLSVSANDRPTALQALEHPYFHNTPDTYPPRF